MRPVFLFLYTKMNMTHNKIQNRFGNRAGIFCKLKKSPPFLLLRSAKGVFIMAVFRGEKTQNYTVMSNHLLRNVGLSLKAKGLYYRKY